MVYRLDKLCIFVVEARIFQQDGERVVSMQNDELSRFSGVRGNGQILEMPDSVPAPRLRRKYSISERFQGVAQTQWQHGVSGY